MPTYRPMVLSRHPSHNLLRTGLPRLPFRCTIRLGSRTRRGGTLDLNTPEAVANAASKLLMKRCFAAGQVKTAQWWDPTNLPASPDFPIVAKHIFGSRGTGNYLLNNEEEFELWMESRDITRETLPHNFIFERFHNYGREYRLHVHKGGCFYALRKLRRDSTPEQDRWKFNNETCLWAVEANPSFRKPRQWDAIVAECIKALASVGLDFGACDVKVRRDDTDFFIIEINSAPSFGERTGQIYLDTLPIIARNKWNTITH